MQPLGAALNGRIVDWLRRGALCAEQMAAQCIGAYRITNQDRRNIRFAVDHRYSRVAERLLEPVRGSLLALLFAVNPFKWRTLASAPAARTGDSDVVKINPGA